MRYDRVKLGKGFGTIHFLEIRALSTPMATIRNNLLNTLCDLSDLSALVTDSENIENFLQRTVALVSEHLETPVRSIYLYDEAADNLELKATKGLNPQAVGQVRMHTGEGLVGAVMASENPVCEGRAGRNPQFKYFPETDELQNESFLAVPILKGVVKIGVLVVQRTTPDYFNTADVTALISVKKFVISKTLPAGS